MRRGGTRNLRFWIFVIAFALPPRTLSAQRAAAAACGGADFGGIQAKAVSSPYVLVGKVTAFEASSDSRALQSAYVLVENVAKAERGGIAQNAEVIVDGLSETSQSSDAGCISRVKLGGTYILFLNVSSESDGRFRVVRLAANYSRSDYTLVREVTCSGCATPPKTTAKKLVEIQEGATDYKLSCRSDSRLLATVDFHKDGLSIRDGSGLHLSEKKRKDTVTRTLRFRKVRPSDAGIYTCFARNALGNSTATTRLVVLPRGSAPVASSSAAPAPGARTVATASSKAATAESPTLSAISHYIECPDRDREYCLHGGICRVRPNGSGRHCMCPATQYVGHRCEERYIAVGTRQVSGDDGNDVVRSHVITALATALGVLLLAVCVYVLYCASSSSSFCARRNERSVPSVSPAVRYDGFAPLCEVDGVGGSAVCGKHPKFVGTSPMTLLHGPTSTQPQPLCVESSLQADSDWATRAGKSMAKPLPADLVCGQQAAAGAASERCCTDKKAGSGRERRRLGATASSTDELHRHGVADASILRPLGRAFTHHALAPPPASVGNPSTSALSSARWTPDNDAPAGLSSSRTGSLYEKPEAVDTSSASNVTREQAICDKQGRWATCRGSSYDTIDNPLQYNQSLLGDAEVLDALLDQLKANS